MYTFRSYVHIFVYIMTMYSAVRIPLVLNYAV